MLEIIVIALGSFLFGMMVMKWRIEDENKDKQ